MVCNYGRKQSPPVSGEAITMVSPSRPLQFLFVPFVIPSHVVPIFETARLFAARGQHVTVITIPAVASVLQSTVDKEIAAGHHVSLHRLVTPPSKAGIPLEKFHTVTSLEEACKVHIEFLQLRPQIEEYIAGNPPDCIVSDMFYPWTADLAAKLGIPRFLFHVSSVISLCLETAVGSPDSPHWNIQSDYEPFVVPGLPDPITLTRSQLPSDVGKNAMFNEIKEAESRSYGVLVNSFEELESAYTEHYKKISGIKIFNIGPVALIHKKPSEKAERVFKSSINEEECLNWLNSKEPNSVIYICFGTTCSFRDDQLMEIACGLEDSGHNFIWVVHGKDNRDDVRDRSWLPEGYEERTKDRGLVVRGWAPQVLILNHPSLGGFLCHCGWNSITEGVCAGLPMVTWPVHSEQFYNERLVTLALKIGVEVGSTHWNRFACDGNNRVSREMIANAVKRLLGGGDAVETMRQKVSELRKTAHRAVEEGGSSHRNLTVLIEEVQRIRDQKA